MSGSASRFSDCDEPLHVHDLPQIYTRPSYDDLLSTLNLLKIQPTTFNQRPPASGSGSIRGNNASNSILTPLGPSSGLKPRVSPEGVPRYLTSIISSPLSWLPSDDHRETIYDLASSRLAERSGRSAMPSMTRSFTISTDLTVDLFEPSLTEDNLGFKTWTSSLLLARRLHELRKFIPRECDRVLELGSGTGLVGIAAWKTWECNVVLTDLKEIVGNLKRNVDVNYEKLSTGKGEEKKMEVMALNWADNNNSPSLEEEKFDIIIAADPIYSSDHPSMLVNTVERWVRRTAEARFIVELPLREGYEMERHDLKQQLNRIGMKIDEEGTEIGYDDWQNPDGEPAEVKCWWSVWKLVF